MKKESCPDCSHTSWTVRMQEGIDELKAFGENSVRECNGCGHTKSNA